MRLAEKLGQLRTPDAAPGTPTGNPVEAALGMIPDQRLQHIGALLRERIAEQDVNAEDALLIRLLLDDYTTSVLHLRAAAQRLEERLDAARTTIRDGRRMAERERTPGGPQSPSAT